MANDAKQVRVASNGQLYVAPVGTPLPDDPTEDLDAAFVGLGYMTEDGATLTATPDIAEFMAWQARQAIRRILNAQEVQIAGALEEWTAETVTFAFGGGAVTEPSPGVFRYDFPAAADQLDERAAVLDWSDGDIHNRIVLPKGNVTEAVDTTFVRSALAVLPVTFKALAEDDDAGAGYVLSDDPAFGTAS